MHYHHISQFLAHNYYFYSYYKILMMRNYKNIIMMIMASLINSIQFFGIFYLFFNSSHLYIFFPLDCSWLLWYPQQSNWSCEEDYAISLLGWNHRQMFCKWCWFVSQIQVSDALISLSTSQDFCFMLIE